MGSHDFSCRPRPPRHRKHFAGASAAAASCVVGGGRVGGVGEEREKDFWRTESLRSSSDLWKGEREDRGREGE